MNLMKAIDDYISYNERISSLDDYITEKLHLTKDNKDIIMSKDRNDAEKKEDAVSLISSWIKENTDYKDDDDFLISEKSDYIFVIIYGAEENELKEIGAKLTQMLKNNELMEKYDNYEFGSTNKTTNHKKLVFRLDTYKAISRGDFKATFKRTRRY